MKIQKNIVYSVILGIIIAVAVLSYYTISVKPKSEKIEQTAIAEPEWYVDNNGILHYTQERGEVLFSRQNYNETDALLISKIVYKSKGTNIYGFLVQPKEASELLPGVVLLPGAGVSKEAELDLAKKIAFLGMVVLTIDQRGVGETNGEFPTLNDDFITFSNGQEPTQYLMVYDALRAFDLLKSAPFVDQAKIIFAGESLGGRIAVMAAAIDSNVNSVLAISSAGINFREGEDANVNLFMHSLDSDNYIGFIAPRKVVFIHNLYDKAIPINYTVKTLSNAKMPKSLLVINDTRCNHGYCDGMYAAVVDSMNYLVGVRAQVEVVQKP